MRLNAKSLIPTVLVLLAVPVLLLFGINLILQTPSVQERIHASLEKSIGMPISLAGISVTSCGGIKVREVSSKAENGHHFAFDSLILYPCYLKLLQGEIVIRKLVLQHPVVRYSMADSAATHPLPAQQNITVTSSIQQALTQPLVTSSLSSSSPTSGTPSLPAASGKTLRTLPLLTMTDGEVTLLNGDNLPIASVQGMNLTGKLLPDGSSTGLLTATQITVGSSLIVHDLSSSVTLSSDASTLILGNLTATLGGGKLTGDFSLALLPSVPEYKTQLTLAGASLNQFFLDASLGNSAAEGAVAGNLQLSGIAGIPRSMEGKGNLLCTNAVIQPADFLKQIGQILQIQELQILRLAEGKALFRIQQGDVQIDQLALRSENLILTAQGPLHSNGDLDLQARLLFNQQLTGRLHGFLGPQLTQAPEAGYSQVAFHVSGSARNPKTDLLERLTGIHINGDLGGLLQGLFGRPH